MTLLQKLNNIYMPRIPQLPNGSAMTVEEFWNTFIVGRLPEREAVLKWHNTLMEYVKRPDAVFAIRGYNTAPKVDYDSLRRGFLSKTNEEYSFFYTDNFHAAYYLKMAIDGYVPAAGEMASAFSQRLFPSRFGRDTANERALMAIPKGADPGIQNAGYKIAHIINVGTDYCVDSQRVPFSILMRKYFDGGDRKDWTWRTDQTGSYYLRDYVVKPEARKLIVAEFLRFVHPFNYFLTPKKTCAVSSVCKDIAEYQPLIDYVRGQYEMIYGDSYRQFLNMILYDTQASNFINGKVVIDLRYGIDTAEATSPTKSQEKSSKMPVDVTSSSKPHQTLVEAEGAQSPELRIVMEYLTNPETSFRKLERQFMGIDSQARGGGFASKSIVNSYGIVAEMKGALATASIEKLLQSCDGKCRETLIMIKELFRYK